jgi:hypothetical protein
MFCGIDMLVVWKEQLDCHFIGMDVLLHHPEALIVHDV